MKRGRGSTDATSPRAINQTGPAAQPVQIGLISLGIKQESRYKDGGREGGGKQGGERNLNVRCFTFKSLCDVV